MKRYRVVVTGDTPACFDIEADFIEATRDAVTFWKSPEGRVIGREQVAVINADLFQSATATDAMEATD